MGLALTYDSPNARVVITVSGISSLLTGAALIERSIDQILWSPVRGGAAAGVTAGVIAPTTFYDHEFSPGITNYYRMSLPFSAWDAWNRTVSNGLGTADSGQVYSTTGAASSFAANGSVGQHIHPSVNVLLHSILPTAMANDFDILATLTKSVNSASGAGITQRIGGRGSGNNQYYTIELDLTTAGNITLAIAKVFGGAFTQLAGTLTVGTGHVANDPWRVHFQGVGNTFRANAWKLPAAEPVGWQLTTTDPGASIPSGLELHMASRLEAGNTNTLPVTFGWEDFIVADFANHVVPGFTANITPAPFERIWLKSTARSFLNQQVTVVDYDEPARDARGGMAYVDGRSLALAQVELMTGRRLTLTIRTSDLAVARRWDFLIASGDVLFLQTPAGCAVPSGYFRVDGNLGQSRPWAHAGSRYFALPLVEAAAPGPDIVAAQSTFDTIIAQYGSYDALLAAIGTSWDQFYTLVGDPSEVIVP